MNSYETYSNMQKGISIGRYTPQDLLDRINQLSPTGLIGIGEEHVVYNHEFINPVCEQVLRALSGFKADRQRKESILLDSYNSATIEGARTTISEVKKHFSNPNSKDDKMVINTVEGNMIDMNEKPQTVLL